MRQELKFDLHFTSIKIQVYTRKGANFMHDYPGLWLPTTNIYAAAIEAGLKVSFETAEVRDKLTSIQIKETI